MSSSVVPEPAGLLKTETTSLIELVDTASPSSPLAQCTDPSQDSKPPHGTASPPTTFTLFPKLPLELRLRIWKCIDIPHDICITVTSPSKDVPIKKPPTFKLHTPLPVILHVCHETRTQALKTYKTLFKVKDRHGVERDEMYFDPILDSVFVSIPRCTRDWIIYTGGHIHLPRPDVKTPFDPAKHNILRCQVSDVHTQGYGKHEMETIVVVQPTKHPLAVQINEQTTNSFESLARVAGDQWKSVDYFVWKPEWWSEHWEFLFSELVKEEPVVKKKGRPRGSGGGKHRKIGGAQKGW